MNADILSFPASAPSVPSLSSSAMLVNLSIGSWSASKKDKSASAQVAADNNVADPKLARAYKTLVSSPKLDAIKSFVVRAHEINRTMTLEWAASLRLCPTTQYFKHTKTLSGLKADFDAMVDDFISTDYQWAVQDMQLALGRLYNAAEYPSASELRQKFYFDVQYMPVPDAGDFRVDIANEAQEVLKAHYEKLYQDTVSKAMRGLWDRLHEALTGMAKAVGVETYEEEYEENGQVKTRTKTRNGRLYDARINDMNELIGLLDTLNVTNDPALQRAQRQLALIFEGVESKDDLARPADRAHVKEQIDEIIAALPSLDW